MDCKSPIFILADMSARKQPLKASTTDTFPPPNFDEPVDSPGVDFDRKQLQSDSPFIGISRRYIDGYPPGSSPQVGGFGQYLSSPQVRGDFKNQIAQSPPMTSRSDSGDSSPSVSTSKQFSSLGDVKASPRIDVLMQAVDCADKQKKKRQPPNPEKKSQYRGVSWQKTSRAWVAQFKSNGKTTYLGLFATEQEAARAYDVAVYTNAQGTNTNPRLNFGTPDAEIVKAYIENGHVPPGRLGATATRRVDEPAVEGVAAPTTADDPSMSKDKHTTSNYRGVSWYAARQIWKASIQVNRKKEYIGRFETEEEAARAYNRRAMELRGKDAILNQVPDTVTRFPPGEVQQMAKEMEESKAKKKVVGGGKKTKTAEAGMDEETSKRAKRSRNETQAVALGKPSAFNAVMPSTPEVPISTPAFFRSFETENRKRFQPIPKPAFTDDEVQQALRNVGPDTSFDPNLFASPLPTTGLKRTERAPLTMNGTAFTPMFNGLFDSPFPAYDANVAFTPSDLAPYRMDLSTARKGRKALVAPYS